MQSLRVLLVATVLLILVTMTIPNRSSGEDNETFFGPIAHIEVEHKKIDGTRYFQLDGSHSYMHVGHLVEYEWHIVRNDTEESFLYGPFQVLEIMEAGIFNISLKIITSDTREDTKTMSIEIRDSGLGYTTLKMRINQDERLVEKLEQERTIVIEESEDPTLYYIIIGILGVLLIATFTVIIILVKRRKTS